ncbi:MAG: hypothetical protein WDO15_24685 [Bacteroidota bacterium]
MKDAAITGDLVVTGASITDDPGYMRGSKQGLLSIRHLTFRNCTFDNVSIDSIKLQSLKLFDCKGEFLTLIDVSIDTLQAYDTKFNAFSLFTFAQTFTSYANHFTEIFLSNCEIPDFQNLSVDIDDMRIFGPKEMRLTKSRVGTPNDGDRVAQNCRMSNRVCEGRRIDVGFRCRTHDVRFAEP